MKPKDQKRKEALERLINTFIVDTKKYIKEKNYDGIQKMLKIHSEMYDLARNLKIRIKDHYRHHDILRTETECRLFLTKKYREERKRS